MRRLRSVLVVGTLLAAASGCADLVTDISEYGRIGVRTELQTGEPVPGAEVTLYTGTHVFEVTRTDADGRHVFAFVAPGNYGVVLRPPLGYRDPGGAYRVYRDGIRMEEGTEEEVTFVLERCMGSIHVRVEDGDGNGVPDARLRLYDDERTHGRAVTGPDGTYTFEEVGCGPPYGVSVIPPEGYGVDEGRGSRFFDGLEIEEDGEQLVVVFRLSEE